MLQKFSNGNHLSGHYLAYQILYWISTHAKIVVIILLEKQLLLYSLLFYTNVFENGLHLW